jgi:cystathionine beta-synthase
MYYNNILETVGNTPLVKINRVTKDMPCLVLAKLEEFNPGNSVKDRIGIKMIEDAERAGRIKPGGTIIEGTSGNTGMGLALAAIIKGYKCLFVTTDKQSKEKMDMLRAVGAEVIVCPTNVGPEDPRSYYSVSKRLSREMPNSFYPNQYDNLSNRAAHYETTGPEIWKQTDGKITHFVAGVGTGGTISGTAKYLKEQNPDIKIWGVDTYGSVFKKYHETGEFDTKEIYPYITEGIGEDILPANVDFSLIDHFEKVSDKDSFIMTRRIVREEGILAGNSSGAALAGVIQMKDQLKEGDVVVVLFPDHASRYIGKAFNDEWMRERGFIDNKPVTALDILNGKDTGLISIDQEATVHEAITLMREKDVDQLVVTDKDDIIGSLTEIGLYSKLLENPESKNYHVQKLMEKSFPIVDGYTNYNEISKMINRENPAVLVKTPSGVFQIITKHDIIKALAS